MHKPLQSLCFSLCLCLTAALASAVPFVSPHDYSLTPAAGWRTDNSHTSGDDLSLFAPGTGNLTVENLNQPPADECRKSFAHTTILSETYSTVGSIRAIDVVFTHPRNGSLVRDHQTIIIEGKSI